MAFKPILNDIYLAVNSLNNNKSPKSRGICAEVLKYSGEKMFELLNILMCH